MLNTCFRRLTAPVALVAMAVASGGASAAPALDAEQLEFFEKRVRPVLAQHCYQCHSSEAKQVKGGLLLDSADGVMAGGKTGEVVVPGDPSASRLIEAISHANDKLQMPPKGKLSDAQIAALTKWVKMGAPDPRTGAAGAASAEARGVIDIEAGREFWAFKPVTNPPAPKVRNAAWPRDDIDRFILAGLEGRGLDPVKDADRATLIRRVTFDLTGLPPTLDEIDAFLDDRSPTPKAFEKVVDRLLASPRFGERWGRHWLDTARYAESIGKTRNYPFPHAWRYRDYVIGSFNADKPYDRFVREQIAGDLMSAKTEAERNEQLTATGFLALGSHDLNERDNAQYTMDAVDEQINVVGRSVLALTLGCARCHDHKFDPIPTADYYALAGIFKSSELLNGYKARGGGGNKNYGSNSSYHALAKGDGSEDDAKAAAARAKQQRVAKLQKQIEDIKRRAKRDKQFARTSKKQLKTLTQQLKKARGGGNDAPTGPVAMGVREGASPADCRVCVKGDPHDLGPAVPRGVVQVADWTGEPRITSSEGSGRRELADWITSPDNPLTARVMVNRVWQHLFGRGIVRTVDNFGIMGDRPTHPELLDHLATGFVSDGWSVKLLIRRIVLSRTYQLSGAYSSRHFAVDPDNVLHWRMQRRRLEVEAIRDAILMVSGQLDLSPRQASPIAAMKRGEIGRTASLSDGAFGGNHRSVYLPIVRQYVPEMFKTFDFAEPSETKGQRDVTTVAPQALFMMNSALVRNQARHAAERLMKTASDDTARVTIAYRQALGRSPSQAEADRVLRFVKHSLGDKSANESAQRTAWADVYHALLASAEFRYIY